MIETRFSRRLPKYLNQISDMNDLFIAEDKEFDRIDDRLGDFENALFVSGLKFLKNPEPILRRLEDQYGLPHNLSVEKRIQRIITKMNGTKVCNIKTIIDLCDSYGFYARFVPEYEKYNFILKVFNNLLDRHVISDIEEIKPAHLNFLIHTVFTSSLDLITKYADLSYDYILCGERKCATVYRDRYVGENVEVVIGVDTAENTSDYEYIVPSAGTRTCGESTDVVFQQDLTSGDVYEFTEDN